MASGPSGNAVKREFLMDKFFLYYNGLSVLRLDNTGVCLIEVYPSLLCDQMSGKIDLYIKLKLVVFSFI